MDVCGAQRDLGERRRRKIRGRLPGIFGERGFGLLFDELEVFADVKRQECEAKAHPDLDLLLRKRGREARTQRQKRGKPTLQIEPQPAFSSAIRLRRIPTCSISTSTVSPLFIQTGGLRAWPTPDGVPVKMTSPGSRLMPCVM